MFAEKRFNLMELNSTVTYKWKLCMIVSFFSCFIILLYLNQNDQIPCFSPAKISMLELNPLDLAEAPVPTTISQLPRPTMLSTISPPPGRGSMIIKETTQQDNVISYQNAIKQPMSTQKYTTKNSSVPLNELPRPTMKVTEEKCNIFDGRWVYKENKKPYYDSNTCPFIEEKMNCRNNGRPDFEYEKWRWEAKNCDIPLFNGRYMLERLRNKRLILVGDSLNRNMWESLACLLYTSVPSPGAEVDANGSDYKVLKAKDYNATIEFYWSPFLIDFDKNHKSENKVLVLEKLSPNSEQWKGADVMVFNSGAWWTHTGKLKAWDLFEYKGHLVENMSIDKAYDKAMKTWATWIQKNVDPNKTTVFFRSISAQHNAKQWCYNSTLPFIDEYYEKTFPKALTKIIESLIKGMRESRVQYLNITKLSEYRIDAHSSIYWSSWKWKIPANKKFISTFADCIHWCLPGLPDTWNELLYASLLFAT